jgi:hypothetical protein
MKREGQTSRFGLIDTGLRRQGYPLGSGFRTAVATGIVVMQPPRGGLAPGNCKHACRPVKPQPDSGPVGRSAASCGRTTSVDL